MTQVPADVTATIVPDGWAGYFMVYDIVGRESPECGFWVFRTKEEAELKRKELLASRDEDLIVTNYLTNEKEK